MPRELRLELGCPIHELSGHTVNLALHVVLVTLDLQYRVFSLSSLSQNESLLGHVLLDLFKGNLWEAYIVSRAELRQARWLSCESCLDFEDVQKGLSSDLTSMRSQQNVLTSLELNLIGESDSFFKIEVLEERFCELSERV